MGTVVIPAWLTHFLPQYELLLWMHAFGSLSFSLLILQKKVFLKRRGTRRVVP